MIFDIEAYLNGVSTEDIISSLTIDNVVSFLESLGVQNIQNNSTYLVLPTICHNPIDEAESMKLYYYDNYKVFHCYTACGDSFSIFELYRRFMSINYYDVSMEEAIDYVKRFCKNITFAAPQHQSNLLTDFEKYQIEKKVIELPEYSKNVLDCFTNYYHPSWINEGIEIEAMKRFNIKFQLCENRIIIPHYDINGRLVGVRQRALEEDDAANGKYRPIVMGEQLYNHHLHYNLYGIYEHQAAIRKVKRAVLVEAEKSVLLSDTFFGKDSIAVAVCGSQVNKYQIALLTRTLGVNEIIIALDKEYESPRTRKAIDYKNKLKNMCIKYKNEAVMSYIYDDKGLLNEKDSPYDKGKEVFLQLYKERKRLK